MVGGADHDRIHFVAAEHVTKIAVARTPGNFGTTVLLLAIVGGGPLLCDRSVANDRRRIGQTTSQSGWLTKNGRLKAQHCRPTPQSFPRQCNCGQHGRGPRGPGQRMRWTEGTAHAAATPAETRKNPRRSIRLVSIKSPSVQSFLRAVLGDKHHVSCRLRSKHRCFPAGHHRGNSSGISCRYSATRCCNPQALQRFAANIVGRATHHSRFVIDVADWAQTTRIAMLHFGKIHSGRFLDRVIGVDARSDQIVEQSHILPSLCMMTGTPRWRISPTMADTV